MKCFKCQNVFPNPEELCHHLTNEDGVCGQDEFACSQCGLAFEELSDFKNHLEICKRVSWENLQNDAEPDDFEMVFETADGFAVTLHCIDDMIDEVETAECETSTVVQTVGSEITTERQTAEHDVDLHDIPVESDQLKLKTVLTSWGVSPLYKNLTACGINCANMYFQGSRDLEIVLSDDKHLLGYMIKFRHSLRQKKTPGDNATEVQTAVVDTTTEVQTDEAGVDLHDMTVQSDRLELKSLLASWGVSPLYKNLTDCGINCGNMSYLESRDLEIILGNDRHLLGPMSTFSHLLGQWSTDSASNTSDKREEKLTFVDVLNILSHSAEGKRFLSDYEKHIPNDALRRKLVFIILKETFSKGMVLSRSCLNDMAIQICKIFKGEKKHIYYQKIRNRQPTGMLYKKYSNMRHAQLKIAQNIVLNDVNNEPDADECNDLQIDNEPGADECNDVQTDNEPEADPQEIEAREVNSHQSDQCSTDNVEISLNFIKDYTVDCNRELLLEHWKKTFEYRQEKFSKYEDIDEVFADWQPLKRETGHALLCIDFVLKYGVKISNGLNSWNSFFDKNLTTISETVKDTLTKRKLKGLDCSTSFETKNKIIIMALHHLFVPSTTVVNGAKWKPTVPMSQQSFFKTVNGQSVMLSDMARRDNFCKRYGMKNHPLIYEITTCMGTRYSVCIRNVYYRVQSLIEGIDVAYKIFKTLNIDFPLECRKVWTFIEHIFYDEGVNISGTLLSIISDLDKD